MTEKDYDKEDKSGSGSYIECLKVIYGSVEIDSALEYGMSYFSTPLLIEKTKEKVHSVENSNYNRYKKITEKYESGKWSHEFSNDVTRFALTKSYDLVLIDGAPITRSVALVHAMQMGVGIIVVHDTENPGLGYGMADIYRENLGYTSIHFTDSMPYTSVYTVNEKLIGDLNLYIADKNEIEF